MGLLGKKKAQARWVRVAALADFAHSLPVSVDGVQYALLREGDRVWATQASCSHEFSPLCDGIVSDGEVYCEKHGSRFRLDDGKLLSPPATDDIKTFQVKVEDGDVWLFV